MREAPMLHPDLRSLLIAGAVFAGAVLVVALEPYIGSQIEQILILLLGILARLPTPTLFL
jgi:hypothetical protein